MLPGGRRGGGEVVSQGIVDALAAGGRQVRVVGYRRPDDHAPVRTHEICAGRRPIETTAAGPRAFAWMARALATGAPYSSAKYDSRAYLAAARRAGASDAAAVVADHAQVQFAVRRGVAGRAPLVFVAHNAESRVYEQLAADARGAASRWVNAREARRVRGAEADLARRADQLWTLTDDDADYFRELAPGADVRALAVASSIGTPERLPPPEYDVALIGSWSWRANARGLEWFASEVVPRLPADMTVQVAGAGCEWLRGRHANVAVRGVVADAQAFLACARVAAVPAVAGGGVQVKTLDAIATGVPVVATPTGARGVGPLPRSVRLAHAPEEFAAALEEAAHGADRAAQLADAAAWSAARRARFDASVAGWIAELTTGDRDGAAVACRSR